MSPYVTHFFLAFFGAMVHATKAHRDGQAKTFLDFLSLTFMSSFSGVMFSLIGLSMFEPNSYITLAMAGTGGFIGVEGMTYVVDYITKKYKK